MTRKVLFYTHAFGGGGAEIVFSRLAEAFADAGDEVVFAADYPGPSPIPDRANLRHVLLGPSHVASTRRLATLIRSEKPDASFSALGAQNLKHLAAALMAGCRRRCVLGYHGFSDAERRFLSRLSFWATPVLTRLAARTICVSDTLLENICRRWGASRSRTIRIYNPVPRSRAEVSDIVKDREPPLVLGCGRLVPAKRFSDLVAALTRVEPSTTRLAILGEGPDRKKIEAAITDHGLSDRVELPGHVEDVSAWYRRSSCLAICSETESFGLTAAEALSNGLAVVSTDCGGPSEILDHGRYGRIIPIGDIEALATALTQTLAAPGDPAPRRRRAEMFSIGAVHLAYAALIDALP